MHYLNEVRLIGLVMPDSIKSSVNQYGVKTLCFDVRTSESWYNRQKQASLVHHEFHHVILKDIGRRQTLTTYGAEVVAGQRILIAGTLRHRITQEGENRQYYTEIEAEHVEKLSGTLGNGDLPAGASAPGNDPLPARAAS